MPTFDPLTELKKALAEARSQRNGKVVAVVGSGVSMSAAPDRREAGWAGFLELALERCLENKLLAKKKCVTLRASIGRGNTADLLAAASIVDVALRKKADVFETFLRSTVGELRPTSRELLNALIDLEIPVATTNYDGLIEIAADRHAVTWRDHANVERLLKGDISGVLHLHGHWNEPESIVLGSQSYERVLADGHTQAVLRKLFLDRTLLFIGFGAGFEDPNLGGLLRWASSVITGASSFHCRLARVDDVPELKAQHPLTQRVWIIPYGKAYGDLAPFLRSLPESTARQAQLAHAREEKKAGPVWIPIDKLASEDHLLLGMEILRLLEPGRQRIPSIAKVHATGRCFQVSLNPILKQNKDFRRATAQDLFHRTRMINEIKLAITDCEETINQSDSYKPKAALRALQQQLIDSYRKLQDDLKLLFTKITLMGEGQKKAVSSSHSASRALHGTELSSALVNPSRASLRKLFDKIFPTDSMINSFAIDHFDLAYRQFSTGMDRDQKINYIFSYFSIEDIGNALRTRINAK